MRKAQKSSTKFLIAVLSILMLSLLIAVCGCSASVVIATLDMQDEAAKLDISKTEIEDGVQLDVKNVQEYKHSLKQISPHISETELNTNVLMSVGYTKNEIAQMSNTTLSSIAQSKDITIRRTASSVNVGLNMTVTYSTRTLVLPVNSNKPVDYYLVNVIWSWANPSSLTGAPDYIGINLESNKGFYELLQLRKDSDLGVYEYCNFTYNKKVYDGTTVTTSYNLTGKAGELERNLSRQSRSIVLEMPKNEIKYEVPSDPFVYKTVYTDFKGEAQFILQINAMQNESVSQLVGITYGHSTKEYTATFSTNDSVSIGVSADVTGPKLNFGAQSSSGWTYAETEKIESSLSIFTLGYNKIRLQHNKVYNIVNLNSGKALEYAGGVTQTGTPLRLADEEYSKSSRQFTEAAWQWKVEFDSENNCVIIHPAKDTYKYIEFDKNKEVSIGEPPTLSALSASTLSGSFYSPIRVAPYSYKIPQHNVQIANCYKIQGGTNYGSVMNYKSDFYSTVTYGEIGAVDEAKSSWTFYEVPDDKVAEESPNDTSLSYNSVFRMKNVGTGKYMTVKNGSIDYGAEIVVDNSGAGYNKQFKLVRVSRGQYFIEPYHVLGFNLDVPNGNQADGQKIQTYGYNGYTAQQFKFYPIKRNGANVQFIISTVVTNNTKALQANANLSVTQATINKNNANQLWELEYVCQDTLNLNTKDTYFIRNKVSRLYFDVIGSGTKRNTEMLQYDFQGTYNQRFQFSPYWEGSYLMIPQHATNRVVELKGESVNGYRLKLYSKRDDKPYQRFKFLRASADSFYILTGASGYTKAVAVNGDVNARLRLEQWDRNNTAAQQWVIEKYNKNNPDYLYERQLTKLSLTTNASTLYFTPDQTGKYIMETVSLMNTTIKIYEYQKGGFVLKSTSSSGGLNNNAKIAINLNGHTQYKIEVVSNGGNGTAGVIVYK